MCKAKTDKVVRGKLSWPESSLFTYMRDVRQKSVDQTKDASDYVLYFQVALSNHDTFRDLMWDLVFSVNVTNDLAKAR